MVVLLIFINSLWLVAVYCFSMATDQAWYRQYCMLLVFTILELILALLVTYIVVADWNVNNTLTTDAASESPDADTGVDDVVDEGARRIL